MRIFSLMPACSNSQTNRNQKLNHSQNPQLAPKLDTMSKDHVSFTGAPAVKTIDFRNIKDLLPYFCNAHFDELEKGLEKLAKINGVFFRVFVKNASTFEAKACGSDRIIVGVKAKRAKKMPEAWGTIGPRGSFPCKNLDNRSTEGVNHNNWILYTILEKARQEIGYA